LGYVVLNLPEVDVGVPHQVRGEEGGVGRLDLMERLGHDQILPGHLSDLRHHVGLTARRRRAGLTANDGPSFPGTFAERRPVLLGERLR